MLLFPSRLIDALPSFVSTNDTSLLAAITPTELSAPWYHTSRPHLLPFISDRYLSLAAPVLTYWILSTVFHLIDEAELPYFERNRIHPPEELKSRNKVTFWEVIRAVVVQHIIQTSLGLLFLESEESVLETEIRTDHIAAMGRLAPRVVDVAFLLLGRNVGERALLSLGPAVVSWAYWWAIPFVQMILGL